MTLQEINLDVQSYRKMPNPYKRDELSGGIESYILQVDVTQIPEGISLETNPRDQNMRTKVARRIKEGLLDDSTPFHILNRGILISAQSVSFDNTNNKVRINMGDEPIIYGIVDGGHTYRAILENKEVIEKNGLKQYVRIEILTGIKDIFQIVADSRNTSTQVTDQAIAELNAKFDLIKDALKNELYASDIAYRENEIALIDISDILTIMYMFNIDLYPDKDKLPTQSYNAKASTLRDYIKQYDKFGEKSSNPYYKMKNILPDIIELADTIEREMPEKYKETHTNGVFGRIRGVESLNDRVSTYHQKPTSYKISKGLIYPIIGAFRALVEEKDGKYFWATDPLKTWDRIGAILVDDTIGRSRSFNNNPNAAGKDKGLWRQNYQTVFTDFLMERYKNESE